LMPSAIDDDMRDVTVSRVGDQGSIATAT
jgi:hypothetical protein